MGNVEALNALWVGGLRQISVPGGEERVKGGMVVVVVDWAMMGDRMSVENRALRWSIVKRWVGMTGRFGRSINAVQRTREVEGTSRQWHSTFEGRWPEYIDGFCGSCSLLTHKRSRRKRGLQLAKV